MIELQSVKFKNINSVGNYFVEIPLNLYRNIVFIGINGAGKSTILQALSFGLFGKPFTNVKIGSLINSVNRKNLEVQIDFKKGKDSYRIVRGLKPDNFEIFKNNSLIVKDAAKNDYQKKLEYILGFDHKTFINVIILGAATNVPFMQLAAKERRDLIEKLLDLEVFSYMNDFAKKELKEINEKIKDNENLIYKAELNLESKERFKNEIFSSITSNISNHLKKIKEIEEEIKKNEENKKKYTDKLSGLDNDKYLKALEALEKNLKVIDMEIMTLTVENKEVKKKLKFLEENDICPTCQQSLDSSYKKMISNSCVISDSSELDLKRKEITEKIEKIKVYFKKVEIINKEVSEIDSNIKSCHREIKFCNVEIEKLNDQLQTDYDSDINIIKISLNELKTAKEVLREEKTIIEVSIMMLKDDGIKASIIKKYVGVINKLINFYLEKFDFFVKFELNEQFEETFKSRHVDTFSYLNFSEGEKKRIDLAILFVLKEISKRKNMVACNLLAFDETMERIDENAADSFAKILRSSPTNNIIISHDDKIINKFTSSNDCVMRVFKKGKFSYYEKI